MKKSFTCYLVLIFSLISFFDSKSATLPTGFTEKRIATGLDPTSLTALPDGRVIVTIKSGKLLLIKNGELQTTPLLTIPNVDSWNERGCLCVIFDPGFTTNGYIYVYYTYKGATVSNNRVSRFKVTGDVADVNSQLVLLNFNNLSSVGYHNGGGLVFGKDGKIYAAAGENTNSSNAQSFNTLLGKVVRINPDGSIPTDNPFYNSTSGANKAIFALGFRNPFRLKIQPGTGKIYINDVGESTWEEINELTGGKNYGWPMIEGKKTNQSPPANYQDPIYAYSHNSGCSITGGAFYNSPVTQFPNEYIGKYFFLDYCSGWIRYIDPAKNFAMSNFATGINRPVDLVVDSTGNMYYLARGGLGGGSNDDNTSSNGGEIWRISYSGNGSVNIGVNPLSKSVAIGQPVTFVVSATGAAPLKYQWKRNNVNILGATQQSYTIDTTTIADNGAKFSVEVSNATSSKISTVAVLTVQSNTPPIAQILTPVEGMKYEAGSTISFNGTASDKEDGILDSAAFTWSVHFQHDIHFHPAMDPVTGNKSGTFEITDEGEVSDTVWYRIYLTVKDALGTTNTVYRDVYPKKAKVSLNTIPPGLPVKLDGRVVKTPYTFTGVVGVKRSIQADSTIMIGANNYIFSEWSNKGTLLQTIVTPKLDSFYTAVYKASVPSATIVFEKENNLLYPNPFENELQIKLSGPFEYLIMDLTGKVINQGKAISSVAIGSMLNSGSYLIKIEVNKETIIKKITKL